MLGVEPTGALTPVFEAVRDATRAATGKNGAISGSSSSWVPHVTLCYSTAQQPATPIITALGEHLPEVDVTVDAVSLVVQWGGERLWDWRPVGTVRLGTRV